MADDFTRIINLTEATDISDGMYLVTDASTGTRKLSLQKVLDKSGGNVADEYDSTATYDVGDLVVYKGVLYECSSAITTAEAWNPAHWSRINLGDIVADIDGSIEELYEDKANESGEYDDIVAGTAKQLLSSIYTTNDSPYLYRPTPADSDRERVKRIEGLSVGWNQLLPQSRLRGDVTTEIGVALTNNEDGSLTLNGTVTGDGNIQLDNTTSIFDINHVYLFPLCCASLPSNTYFSISGIRGGANGFPVGLWKNESYTTGLHLRIDTKTGDVFSNLKIWPQIVDLTAHFGSNTIPDYILSLEQNEAGSGITLLKTYCPKLFEYNPYSAPTIKSVEGLESHVMVGFNQWDEEWEHKEGYSSGVMLDSDSNIASKNFIRVMPDTNYCVTLPSGVDAYVYGYDADKNFIGTLTYIGNGIYNTGNAQYIKFATRTDNYSGDYRHDICINLSDPSKNGTYEPYHKHSYPLDSTITLRGIPKLVDGQLKADGDWYEPSGKQTERYVEVDLGSLNWNKTNDDSGRFYSTELPHNSVINSFNVICSKYPRCSSTTGSSFDDKSFIVYGSGLTNDPKTIFIRDTSYSDAASFKTAMSGVKLVYELATPTTSTASPYSEVQICDGNGTEEFVTDSVVPVGHLTEYSADLRRQVENIYGIPKPPTTDGDYALKLSIADGVPTYSWESEA